MDQVRGETMLWLSICVVIITLQQLFMFPLIPLADSEVVLTHNKSGRFESRFISVGIRESPSVWLSGMEGSALGVWVAHGEGTTCRFHHAAILNISHGLIKTMKPPHTEGLLRMQR